MELILGFCLIESIGQNHKGATAWSSKNKAKRCGSFFAPGIDTSFEEFAWQRWIVTVAILIGKFKHWFNQQMHWGLSYQWFQPAVD